MKYWTDRKILPYAFRFSKVAEGLRSKDFNHLIDAILETLDRRRRLRLTLFSICYIFPKPSGIAREGIKIIKSIIKKDSLQNQRYALNYWMRDQDNDGNEVTYNGDDCENALKFLSEAAADNNSNDFEMRSNCLEAFVTIYNITEQHENRIIAYGLKLIREMEREEML